ncbi:14693_t:CDS:2, partial [Dentiscutata erythropus]
AREFVDTSLYKHGCTIDILESKIRLARAKQSRLKQVSKIRSSVRKAKQIRSAQFQRAARKLFKSKNKEYNAKFVKLATNISNMRQTSIHATVEYTKAVYQFLTGEKPQYWVKSTTLSWWNNEIAAITSNQNSPKEASSRFF